MESNEESSPVLSVCRDHNQQWHVTADDLRKPLASFDNPQAACAWAIARAKPAQGRVFVEELANSAATTFKYSIPVTWADKQY